jgi:hypothetical protein
MAILVERHAFAMRARPHSKQKKEPVFDDAIIFRRKKHAPTFGTDCGALRYGVRIDDILDT